MSGSCFLTINRTSRSEVHHAWFLFGKTQFSLGGRLCWLTSLWSSPPLEGNCRMLPQTRSLTFFFTFMWRCIVTNFSFPSWSCSKAVYKPAWHIPLLSLQWKNSWWWTEELPETCRVSCQNKFVKLVHLISMFHRAFFNSIIDKTPTDALLIQHYISLACWFH